MPIIRFLDRSHYRDGRTGLDFLPDPDQPGTAIAHASEEQAAFYEGKDGFAIEGSAAGGEPPRRRGPRGMGSADLPAADSADDAGGD